MQMVAVGRFRNVVLLRAPLKPIVSDKNESKQINPIQKLLLFIVIFQKQIKTD